MAKQLDFDRLTATINNIKLPDGPRLDRFSIISGAAMLITKPFQIDLASKATIEAEVSAQSLVDFLEELSPGGLKSFQIELIDGQIFMSAKAKVMVDIPVKAICTLRIHEERELHVELKTMDVMGGPAKKLVEGQFDKVNPIFDVADMPLNMKLKSVEIENGVVLVKGEAHPSED